MQAEAWWQRHGRSGALTSVTAACADGEHTMAMEVNDGAVEGCTGPIAAASKVTSIRFQPGSVKRSGAGRSAKQVHSFPTGWKARQKP
jgi:hypothetical protein